MAEEKEPAEGEEAEAKPKKKLPMMLIVAGFQTLVMLVAVGIIVKGVFFTKGPQLSEAKLRERAIASIKDDSEKVQTLDLKDFIINLPKSHVLRASIKLEVSDPDTAQVIEKRMPAIKYKIINLLSTTDTHRTESFQGKLLLKDALREAINEELLAGSSKGAVREVFFTDFFLL